MLLAIDTAMRFAAVAVVDDGEVVFAEVGRQPRSHVEELGPSLERAMRVSSSLDTVVVGRGPGSFAGLRVGLSAGQTLAWALAAPAVGVCSLDAVALSVDEGFTGYVVTDARRRELYYAEYAHGQRCGDPQVAGREQVATLVAGHEVAGDIELLATMDRKAAGSTAVDPVALGLVGARAVQSASSEPALPLYLRAPDIAAPAAGARHVP